MLDACFLPDAYNPSFQPFDKLRVNRPAAELESISALGSDARRSRWIPAFAGMTDEASRRNG
jgi:hypothetical protein